MNPHDAGVRSVLDLMALPIPDFVDVSYRLLLGRAPNPQELAERSGVVRGGLGRSRFLTDMSLSAEFRRYHDRTLYERDARGFVEELFLRYLGRQPDPGGLDHYIRLLADGRSREYLIGDISRSPEARIRSTFWYELDGFLADERAERHWVRRWIGGGRRRERRHNRMYEVIARHGAKSPPVVGHEAASLPAARILDNIHNMGRNAQQVLARVRYLTGMI